MPKSSQALAADAEGLAAKVGPAANVQAKSSMAQDPLIRAENLSRIYGKGASRVAALDGVDFSIAAGEFVAIIGASGSGKSTLMNLLGALDKPTSGKIIISGTDLAARSQKQLADFRNKIIGFVFQQFQLMPRKSALHNVILPMTYRRPRLTDMTERAKQRLMDVGLGDRMDHKPTELSGGQQQRVAIARALVGDPKILLADEPTGALDSVTSTDVMALLKELNANGITIILITHDPEVAAHAARVITMRDGKIVSDVHQERAA